MTDDGLPKPPAAVITTWSKVSGPGMVTFSNASAIDTTVSFSQAGSYVLRPTADDGELQASDEVTITILQPPSITIISPKGGEVLYTGTTYHIRWTALLHKSGGVTDFPLLP